MRNRNIIINLNKYMSTIFPTNKLMYLNIVTDNKTPDSTYTIPRIKEWAIARGLKIPSGLNKDDMIQYLTGMIAEKSNGITRSVKNSVTPLNILQARIPDVKLDWLIHLHIHGWAVVPIDGWNSAFTDEFLSWFESCSPNFKKNDHNTWKGVNMPNMSRGILKHYFGHTELQWKIRELCAPIFARIWGCRPEDLLCSYDGGCFLPSVPTDGIKNASFKQWIHVDMPRDMRTFSCVQGIVNFEENGPEDGGLVLVEGSHNIFGEYMDKHPSEGITWGPSDMNDPLLGERPLIKICAPACSIILFDTRTFHCNVQPCGSRFRADGTARFRMCTYVSMQPRSGAIAKELMKRISLYEKGRMTGHWCYGPFFKETAEHPRTYGGINNKPEIIEIAHANGFRRRLIGYE